MIETYRFNSISNARFIVESKTEGITYIATRD